MCGGESVGIAIGVGLCSIDGFVVGDDVRSAGVAIGATLGAAVGLTVDLGGGDRRLTGVVVGVTAKFADTVGDGPGAFSRAVSAAAGVVGVVAGTGALMAVVSTGLANVFDGASGGGVASDLIFARARLAAS